MSQALGLTTVTGKQEKDQQGLREVEVKPSPSHVEQLLQSHRCTEPF